MAQHDYSIANNTGSAVRTDLNNSLAAIVSQNSGSSAPSTTFSYQQWADTSAGLLKIRNGANNAWVTVGTLDQANLGLATLASPNLSGNPTAPTPASGDNDTSIATTAFVKALVDSAVATAVGNLTDSQMPAGSVLQVKNFHYDGVDDSTSATNVFGGLTGAITPSSSANKILVTMYVNCEEVPAFGNAMVGVTAYRGSGSIGSISGTNLAPTSNWPYGSIANNARNFGVFDGGGTGDSDGVVSFSHLDSPSSTSSVAYTVAFRNMSGTKARLGGRGAQSTMTLMEIKG
jgi:hypothetical protein